MNSIPITRDIRILYHVYIQEGDINKAYHLETT